MKDGNKVIILGKGKLSLKELQKANADFTNSEVWTVATSDYPNADRYYAFHRESVNESKPVYREYSRFVDRYKVPLNNSISIMIMQAYYEGYQHIKVLGAEMTFKDEYIEQARSTAICVGFVRALGVDIYWDGEPENADYGHKYQKD